MKLIKPVLWTLLGVVIGAAAVVTTSRVQAQQKPTERIEMTPAAGLISGGAYGVYFVKDIKSGGCWIATKESGVVNTLAVAPPSACY